MPQIPERIPAKPTTAATAGGGAGSLVPAGPEVLEPEAVGDAESRGCRGQQDEPSAPHG